MLRKGQPLIPVLVFVDIEVSADKKVDPATQFPGEGKESCNNKPESNQQPFQNKRKLQPEGTNDEGNQSET